MKLIYRDERALATKPVFSVDLDDTVADTGPHILGPEIIGDRGFDALWTLYTQLDDPLLGPDAREMERVIHERYIAFSADEELLLGIPPMSGALETLGELSEKYAIAIVTARGLEGEWATRKWIEMNKVPHAAIGISDRKPKAPLLDVLGAHFHVDDFPPVVGEIFHPAYKGMIHFRRPWSHDFTSPSAYSVDDWQAVERVVRREGYK